MNAFADLVASQLADDLRRWRTTPRASRQDRALRRCQSIRDLRELAERRTPKAVFDYVDGAAEDEAAARRNQAAYGQLELRPRVLVDVDRVDLATTVLGQPIALPILAAPTGMTGLAHHRGELGVAHAAHACGTLSVLSTVASYTIEEVAAAAPGPAWFQLYLFRDRGLVRELLGRARAAGYRALMVTVDVPVAGARERDLPNGFGVPPRLTLRSLVEGIRHPRWSIDLIRRPRITMANVAASADDAPDDRGLAGYINSQFDPSATWADLDWIRDAWGGPIVLKGILRPDDARRALGAGVDGIVVSNHGGRQLAQAGSTVGALPGIVDDVGDDLEVYVDGGVRRGADVAAAVALGARACLVGRPLVYGLAAGGDAGALRAFRVLEAELRRTMALLGCRSLDELDRSFVRT